MGLGMGEVLGGVVNTPYTPSLPHARTPHGSSSGNERRGRRDEVENEVLEAVPLATQSLEHVFIGAIRDQ